MRCAPALPSVFHLLLKFNPPAKTEAQSGAGNVALVSCAEQQEHRSLSLAWAQGPAAPHLALFPWPEGFHPAPGPAVLAGSQKKSVWSSLSWSGCAKSLQSSTHRASLCPLACSTGQTCPAQGSAGHPSEQSLLPGLRALPEAQLHGEVLGEPQHSGTWLQTCRALWQSRCCMGTASMYLRVSFRHRCQAAQGQHGEVAFPRHASTCPTPELGWTWLCCAPAQDLIALPMPHLPSWQSALPLVASDSCCPDHLSHFLAPLLCCSTAAFPLQHRFTLGVLPLAKPFLQAALACSGKETKLSPQASKHMHWDHGHVPLTPAVPQLSEVSGAPPFPPVVCGKDASPALRKSCPAPLTAHTAPRLHL